MNKNNLGKAKRSINKLDANKGISGVSGTQMSIMYYLSNLTSDIADVDSEEKTESSRR